MMQLRRRTWWILGVAAVILTWTLYKSYKGPPRGAMGEVIDPDEPAYIAQIVDNGIRMITAVRQQQGDGVYRRDAHAKTHACVAASFTARPGLDPAMRVGLFADSNPHKAWIRFSSGNEHLRSDWLPDARGMAIKILGVPGKKLLEGEENETTQDFLMINNPTFFIRNVEDYADFTRYQASGSQFGYFFPSWWNPFGYKLREFRIGMRILKWPPKDLLGTRFYSMTAYRLGPANFVKYSARPVACDARSDAPGGISSLGAGALRADLADYVKDKRACFDFMVQLQLPDKNMPVEDPTVEWSERDSPFTPVARIEIQKQVVDGAMQNNFCENLSMTPWHSLPAHEPVGALNRIRKAVYQGIARYRRCMNRVPFGEPKNDGSPQIDSKQVCDPHDVVPVITQATLPK